MSSDVLPKSLPLKTPQELSGDSDISEAYEIAVRLERDVKDEEQKMFARILGYLLIHAVSLQACRAVADEIRQCQDEKSLLEVGKKYFVYFINLFRKIKTYPKSNIPSIIQNSDQIESIKSELEESPSASRKLRENALFRDGYCCVVTGCIDDNSANEHRELDLLPGIMGDTEIAHILPQSLGKGIKSAGGAQAEKQGRKLDYAGNVWSILDLFGYGHLRFELSGANIHRLENVMTLEKGMHSLFDKLSLWLEPLEQQDTYKVCTAKLRQRRHDLKDIITFTTSNPEKYPVPSREYLALHACCARVAHLSGAAEYIDKTSRDAEDKGVLARDGSSANFLETLLLQLAQPIQAVSNIQHTGLISA